MPTPAEVATDMVNLFAGGLLLPRLVSTLETFATGYLLAAGGGIVIGAAIARSHTIETAIEPYINALIATPWIVLIPIITIWFGFNDAARIVVIILASVFGIIINTLSGFKNVPRGFIETARSFGCSGLALYGKVVLPAAFPYIVTGLRAAIVHGLAAALLAEMFLQIVGLGYLILSYQTNLDIANMLAIILVISVIGLTLTETLKFAERRLAAWRLTATGG